MAIRRYGFFIGTTSASPNSAPASYYDCDTEAELPTNGSIVGDMGYARDTDQMYFHGMSGWSPISADAAPGSGSIPESIVDAKGDLIAGTAADTVARLPISVTDGDVLTVDSGEATGLAWTTPTAGTPADIQVFTTPGGTWTKPAGAQTVWVRMIGAGGGGGSGRKGAGGSDRGGGGGGAGGAMNETWLRAADLSGSVTVTVGAGGTGGTAVSTDDTNGNDGNTGGATAIAGGIVMSAIPGGPGLGGTTSPGTGGTATTANYIIKPGGDGGAGNFNSNGASGSSAGGGGGGGGGGGISSGNNLREGGTGGIANLVVMSANGGTAGNDAAPDGGNGSTSADDFGSGGGGGGGGADTQLAHGSGGDGVLGGGGGGGAAGINSATQSGAGGDGGPGLVVMITYF